MNKGTSKGAKREKRPRGYVITDSGERIYIDDGKSVPLRLAMVVCCNPRCMAMHVVNAPEGPHGLDTHGAKCHRCGFPYVGTEDPVMFEFARRIDALFERFKEGAGP